MSRRYLLVGSGIASLAAAEAIREGDPGGEITLVSEEPYPFYSRPGLAYMLARDVPQVQLYLRRPEEIEALGMKRVEGRAMHLHADAHDLRLADGRYLGYDRLLLATGAASIPAPFPGSSLAGVVQLDGLGDAQRLLQYVHPRRTAVVIGGGSTALELVEGLHRRGMRVHYFLRGERYWSKVLDPEESRIVAERLRASGVRVHTGTEIRRALGRHGRLETVETAAGERLSCDLLAVAIGVRPRTGLAGSADLEVDRGIHTSRQMMASHPDVFAAGDAAEVAGPDGGAGDLDTLWSSALAQGRIAGGNMTGATAEYRPSEPLNVTCLAGVVTTIIGAVGGGEDPDLLTLTRGQSERWRTPAGSWTAAAGHGADRIRLVIDDSSVVGAVVMGDQTHSEAINDLVRQRTDISALRDALVTDPEDAIPTLLAMGHSHLRAPDPANGGRR